MATQREQPGAGRVTGPCDCQLVDPSPSQHALGVETAEQIEAALQALPDDHREVLVLARLIGMSHAQIAERMNRSESAVGTLLCRAGVRLLAQPENRV